MNQSIRVRLAKRNLNKMVNSGRRMEVAPYNGNLFDSNGRVYVRELGGANAVRNVPSPMRLAVGVNTRIGAYRIVVIKTDYDGDYIAGNDYNDLKYAGINPRQFNALDPSVTRSKLTEHIANLQTFAMGGNGLVRVMPGIYRKSNGAYGIFEGELDIDLLTSYTPSAGNQHIVALWINEDTNAVTITTSDELSSATNLKLSPSTAITYINQAASLAPTNRIGIGCYIISSDTTAISEEDKFHDLRGMIDAYSDTSSVGYPDPVTANLSIPTGNRLLVSSGWELSTGGSITLNTGSVIEIVDHSKDLSQVSVSGAYTMTRNDDMIVADASSNDVQITLADATRAYRQDYNIRAADVSGGAITLAGYNGQTINGSTSYIFSAQYENLTLRPDGSNWMII